MAPLLLLIGTATHAAEKPILTTGTEQALKGSIRPGPALTRVVLASLDSDDRAMLDECLADKGIRPRDYAALLRTVRIGSAPGRALWLVRPTLQPYCTALYGAHIFRYFLVEERPAPAHARYRLILSNSGDSLEVYARLSHGLNDIQVIGCTAQQCRGTRMAYDGRQYRPVTCSEMSLQDGREVTRPRRCD